MSFTDGKPTIATASLMCAPWSGAKDGRNFRCSICGHFFAEGDHFVFVFSPLPGVTNFLACSTAAGPTHGDPMEMLAAMDESRRIVSERYWWALPHGQRQHRPGAKRDSRADRQDP